MDPQLYVLGLIVLGLPAVSGSFYLLAKPLLGAFMRNRELKAGVRVDPSRLDAQEQRIAVLEGELAVVRDELERLNAVEGFYKELRSAPEPGSVALPPGT